MIRNLRLSILFATIILIGVINSCKKDLNKGQQSTPSDPSVLQAKDWYESTYPINTSGKLTLQSMSASADKDYSQFVKPDWNHAKTYKRFDQNVIEMPVDPSGKIAFTWQNKIDNRVFYREKYSRSYFLLLNNGNKYDAYIMTVIADSAYVKNDLSKLDHNTYSQRDSDFSGVVIYHTPKGKYVSGWSYTNGHINTKVSTGGSTAVQNTNGRPLKTNTEPTTAQVCVILWEITYIDGVAVSAVEIDRDCYLTGGGGGGSGGGSETGNNAPPVPPVPECADGDSDSDPGTGLHSIGHQLVINTAVTPINNPGGGGGFPPPKPQQPCSVALTIKTDTLSKHFPCAVKLIIDQLSTIGAYSNLVTPFVTSQKPDITWTDGALPWNSTGPLGGTNNYQLGQTGLDPTSGLGQSSIITLNNNMLKNSSMLLIAAAAIHETLHAFINYNIATAHDNQTQGYVTTGSWLYALDSWASISGLPSNYRDHYEMLSDYFDKATSTLAAFDNNAHTPKEYQMAMLFGLDNASDGNASQKALLQTEFNSLLTKYNITQAQLSTFNTSNLNSSTSKLPTSGCN